MDSIVSNITGGFLNDILKATAPEREYANYQNVILPELVSAVKKYNDFKDCVLENLRSRKSQPTIKEAFAKCERDSFVKKLNEQDAVLKDCVRMNQKFMQDVDYFMKIKMPQVIVDNQPKCVSPLQSAHQKAREYAANEQEAPKVAEEAPKVAEEAPKVAEEAPKVAEEAPKVAEEAPKVAEEAPKVAEEAPKVAEEAPNIQITITENDVVVAQAEAEEEVEVEEEAEVEAEVEETVEEVEAEVEVEVEVEEEVDVSEEEIETDADQAPEGDVEVEEDEEEEVEEYTHKGKKYYVTNTTNGKIYACTTDDDIGDQVGSFKNGKPIFS